MSYMDEYYYDDDAGYDNYYYDYYGEWQNPFLEMEIFESILFL